MYVCVYVCMFACMHICMNECVHVCMYACMYVCTVCMYECMHACMHAGLPDWAISRELGYQKVLLATDFYDRRFANFWTTRNFDERILDEQILSFSVSLFV